MTVFGYGFLLHALPLQRTASVGAVASGTSVKDAAPELTPAALVAAIVSPPAAVVPVLVDT
jgi:hypothetical protein